MRKVTSEENVPMALTLAPCVLLILEGVSFATAAEKYICFAFLFEQTARFAFKTYTIINNLY